MAKELTEFGKAFEKIRSDNNDTIQECSKKIGISISYISSIVHGDRDIPFDLIDKIANAYNLSIDNKKELEEAMKKTPRIKKISKDEAIFALEEYIDQLEVSPKEKNELKYMIDKIIISLK